MKGYLKVLKGGLIKLDSNYSGSKLNNILKKSFMLEELRRKYDEYIKKVEFTPKIIDYLDESFPF